MNKWKIISVLLMFCLVILGVSRQIESQPIKGNYIDIPENQFNKIMDLSTKDEVVVICDIEDNICSSFRSLK